MVTAFADGYAGGAARLRGWGDKAAGHSAEAFEVAAEDLARSEELGRLAGRADAGRGAGEDQVAGQQGQHRGQPGDELGHAEDQLRGAALLDLLAIDAAAELKVVRVRELVGCHEPRAGGAEAGEGLAERELPSGGELDNP